MNVQRDPAVAKRFVTSVLPWLIGAAALLLYLITLNGWVSLYSLGPVARVSGWLWRPEFQQPLVAVLVFPFRCLPEPWIPRALNIFAALCASAVLTLLARSVALLRHDLAHDDPFRKETTPLILGTPTAWIPPVLAAIVCGLQLTFWEQATSFTGTMIDLLVFAYVIRCVLEFRMDQDRAWISRCAFVYGAGMANDWVLIAYLPVMVAAVLWITGFTILYDRKWLLRVALCGSAGLSLYLLLPLADSLSSNAELGFWPALKANLKSQKTALSLFRRPAFRIMALTSLLPVVVLSVRWKSHSMQFNDDTRLGVFLTKTTVHFVHALFFACSLWIALDPTFSPRHLDLGMPMLTYYYTSAMVAGYCAGHFLLVGSGAVKPAAARLVKGLVYVLACAMPIVLVSRNLRQVAMTNGPALREFARQLEADLPPPKSVVLSDDPRLLYLLQAQLAADGKREGFVLLETPSLASAAYQHFMAGRLHGQWPVALPTNRVERIGPLRIIRLVSAFAAREPVVYLQTSVGPVFERFIGRPNGLVYFLEKRERPPEVELNLETAGQVWQTRWNSSMQTLAMQGNDGHNHPPPILSTFKLEKERNFTQTFLAAVYAKSLVAWGVALQRLDRWPEAALWFKRAADLNPENVSAQINAEYNQRYQAGDPARLEASALQRKFQDLFGKYRSWPEILTDTGPVDEPTVLFEMAKGLLATSNTRQAASEFARCADLAPAWLEPQVWLALSAIALRDYAAALRQTDNIASTMKPQDANGVSKLVLCRTTALQGLGRTNEAASCLENFVSEYRERAEVLSIAADLFAQNIQFEQALQVLDQMLKSAPDDLKLLARKGWAELELARYEAAVATLTAVVSRAPADENARLDLAIARLGAGHLEAARADYEGLLKSAGRSKNALFGLGGIAWRERDTNAAIDLYQQYLSNSIPDTPQYAVASERLKRLKAGAVK